MAAAKAIPGMLWVNSDVIKPDQLSRRDFNDWYCDENIHDVVAKSGVTSAHRYQHIDDGSTPSRRLGCALQLLFHSPCCFHLHVINLSLLDLATGGSNFAHNGCADIEEAMRTRVEDT
jgi:hypothetical protein